MSFDDTLNLIQQTLQQQQPNQGPQAPQQSPMDKTFDLVNRAQTGTLQPPIPTHEDVANIGAASNTRTGFARGLGNLLDMSGQAGLIEQQAPPEVTPKPGEIGQAAQNYTLGGQNPYQPQTPLGRIYQNSLADTVTGAPMAALGAGGIGPFLMRQGMNVAGNVGGEVGKEILPSHPIIGGLAGSLAGSSAIPAMTGIAGAVGRGVGNLFGTGGSVERKALDQFSQNPSAYMPMDAIDNTLKQHVSPGMQDFVTRAPEDLKREAVGKIMGITPPTEATGPGFTDRLVNHGLDRAMGGLGLAAGGATDVILSHFGIPTLHAPEGIGLAAGEVLQHYMKPYLDQRAAALNQRVGDALKNNQSQMYQMYQAQQQAPGIVSRLLGGLAAPAVNVPGMGY